MISIIFTVIIGAASVYFFYQYNFVVAVINRLIIVLT